MIDLPIPTISGVPFDKRGQNRIGRAVLAARGSESLNFKGLLIGDRPIRAMVCSGIFATCKSFICDLINKRSFREHAIFSRRRARSSANKSHLLVKAPGLLDTPFAR